MEVTEHAPGTFCWTDLSTSDAAAAKQFYGTLFGWEYDDIPMGDAGVYTMVKLGGKEAGALYQDTMSGTPPHWNCYVNVPNVENTIAEAKSLGGSLLMDPHDVFEAGRMAILQDPTGAVFMIWQPKGHIGARVTQEPGTVCWNELMTRDTEKAIAFYTALFGWAAEPFGPDYTTYKATNGSFAAGMSAITAQMGPVPPNWMPYFNVANTDTAAATAESAGGKILVPPTDIPTVGRFSVIQDPQGAVFGIIS